MKNKQNKTAKVFLQKLGREQACGICDYKKGQIKIDPRLKPFPMLETVLHESLHWLEPEWSETKVTTTAKKLAKIVWDFKFRQLRELPE
jgi:hypothetical protein